VVIFFPLVFLGNLVNIPFTIYFSHVDKKLYPEKKGRNAILFFLEFQVDFMARGPVKNLKERKKERKKEKAIKVSVDPLVAKDQKPHHRTKCLQ
jgi:hypothetical protein